MKIATNHASLNINSRDCSLQQIRIFRNWDDYFFLTTLQEESTHRTRSPLFLSPSPCDFSYNHWSSVIRICRNTSYLDMYNLNRLVLLISFKKTRGLIHWVQGGKQSYYLSLIWPSAWYRKLCEIYCDMAFFSNNPRFRQQVIILLICIFANMGKSHGATYTVNKL